MHIIRQFPIRSNGLNCGVGCVHNRITRRPYRRWTKVALNQSYLLIIFIVTTVVTTLCSWLSWHHFGPPSQFPTQHVFGVKSYFDSSMFVIINTPTKYVLDLTYFNLNLWGPNNNKSCIEKWVSQPPLKMCGEIFGHRKSSETSRICWNQNIYLVI